MGNVKRTSGDFKLTCVIGRKETQSHVCWKVKQRETKARCTYFDIVFNLYESAADEGRLRKRRNNDLFFPLQLFPSLHRATLHLCNCPDVMDGLLRLVGDSLKQHIVINYMCQIKLKMTNFLVCIHAILVPAPGRLQCCLWSSQTGCGGSPSPV